MKVDFIFDPGSSKEDSYLIKDNLFAVFDGFNGLEKFFDKEGVSGGLLAANISKEVFSQNNGTLESLAIKANRKIRERAEELNLDVNNKSKLWGTTLAAVKIKNGSFEWGSVGDSLVLVIFRDNSYKLLVEDYDHDGEVLALWKKMAEKKEENIAELILEPITRLRAKVNEDYGALNGEDSAIKFLRMGEESLQNVKTILLFTDGLFLPKENPTDMDDWALFTDIFLKGGLFKLKEYVRSLQIEDPKCWKYPRYKKHDDITAISISL
ncbi:hypothetical protein C4572_00475 [Candidatus Parcubacteria bacterium]|nr:MAG: hypothetical protein C4572_00475 [Candidatus Parcubacteria bacterium]